MEPIHRSVREILGGSVSYLVSGIVSGVAPFLVSLLVSRYLGKEALGLFSVCFALVLAGVLLSDLGLNLFIMREFAGTRRPANLSLRVLLTIRTLAALISGGMIVAITLFLIRSSHPGLLSVSAFALIVVRSYAGALENLLKARLRRGTFAAITASSSFAHLTLVLIILSSGFGITVVFLVMTCVEVAKAIVLSIIFRGDVTTSDGLFKLSLREILPVLKNGFPFALIGLFTLVSERAPLFLLAAISGNAQAGVYSAADRFLIIGTLLDSSLFASAFPIFSLFRNGQRFDRVTRQTLTVVSAVAVLGTVALFAGAPLIIGFTFRYEESVGLLRVLSLSLPAILWASIIRIALFSTHRERSVAHFFGGLSMVAVLLYSGVISVFGSMGAAVVSVIVEYAMACGFGWMYLKSVQPATASS